MKINNVMTNVVKYGVKKPLNWVANSKLMNNVCKNYQNDNLKYIAALGITSIVLKDGFGCYLYVKQSLNNKKIPDDKRKFVAAMDLVNGGLMILSQLIMFKTISNKKVQDKMFKGLFGKLFNEKAKEACMNALKQKGKIKNFTPKDFSTAFDKFHNNIKGTFGLLTTLVASTILAKRVIVPFIATPLAEKAKGLLGSDDKTKTPEKDTFSHEVKK